MSLFSNFSENFEQLLLQKSFHELNADELKALDAEGMGEDEYNQIRATLISLEDLDEELDLPSANRKEELLAIFDEGAEKKGIVIRWPVWSAVGLAVAAMIAVAFFLFRPDQASYDTGSNVAQSLDKKEDSSSKELVVTEPSTSLKTDEVQRENEKQLEVSVAEHADEASPVVYTAERVEEINAPLQEDAGPMLEKKQEVVAPIVSTSDNITSTFSSGNSVTLSTNAVTTYKWDATSLSNVAVAEKKKNRKKENADVTLIQSIALSAIPQAIQTTVTVF
ncbi:MAG: hypothetical protein RLZZ543_500 [Bacteroidota bacterium]|jgi:hypothetical protein